MATCPVCGKALVERRKEGESLRYCGECGGVWLARDAFSRLTAFLSHDPRTPVLKLDRSNTETTISRTERRCPDCGETMRQFNYAGDSGIFLDRCTRCDGIWADKAELKSVAIFRKGNPKLDRLGESVAEYAQSREQYRETARGERMGTGAWLAWYVYGGYAFVPISDDEETSIVPWVTIGLIIVNVVIWLWSRTIGEGIYRVLGTTPADLWHGKGLWTLITSGFMHGGPMHLVGNMLFLWIFGDNVEDRFGHRNFILFYIGALVASDLAHAAIHPTSTVPCVGASGAVSAIMGAYLILHPFASLKTLIGMKIPAVIYLLVWVGEQFVLWYFEAAVGRVSVAWAAHLGGFAFGILVIIAAGRRVRRLEKAGH